MSTTSIAAVLAQLTPVAASLVAISVTVLLIGPTLLEVANSDKGVSAEITRRSIRRSLNLLAAASLAFLTGVLLGILGAYFPSFLTLICETFLVISGLILTGIAILLMMGHIRGGTKGRAH